MHSRIAGVVLAGAVMLAAQAVSADDAPPPSDTYFISMRSPDVDAVLRYVSAVPDATDEASEPVSGCDGKTYYVTSDDKAAVIAALANGNTVQLQSGPAGATPAETSVTCLIQASS